MKHWGTIVSGGGATFLSLLSCALCPLCIPFYLGGLTLVGLELESFHHVLEPLVTLSSLLTLGLMAYQIRRHQGRWLPLVMAGLGALGIVMSTFLEQNSILYVAIPLFMGSIWWNRRYLNHHGHA